MMLCASEQYLNYQSTLSNVVPEQWIIMETNGRRSARLSGDLQMRARIDIGIIYTKPKTAITVIWNLELFCASLTVSIN
jgi:hypothetical protein